MVKDAEMIYKGKTAWLSCLEIEEDELVTYYAVSNMPGFCTLYDMFEPALICQTDDDIYVGTYTI